MNTRLTALAGSLNGGPAFEPDPHQDAAAADEARQEALARSHRARHPQRRYDAWQAALPDDVGPAGALTQPRDITRFDAAVFTWRGGSNAVDNPVVRVERLTDGAWQPYADQTGEVQTMVRLPEGANGPLDTCTGGQEWRWTATFEAFDAFPAPSCPAARSRPARYRFVVDGHLRQAGQTVPYHLESDGVHGVPVGRGRRRRPAHRGPGRGELHAPSRSTPAPTTRPSPSSPTTAAPCCAGPARSAPGPQAPRS